MSSSEETNKRKKKMKLILHFHIQSAKGIRSSRTRRKRLLFVLDVDGFDQEQRKHRTKIIKNTENPRWGERGRMDLGFMSNTNRNEKIRMSVWDVKTKTNHKCKGTRAIAMKDLIGSIDKFFTNDKEEKEKKNALDVELEGCTRGIGSVQVELTFTKEAVFVAEEEEDEVFKTPILKVKEEDKGTVAIEKKKSEKESDDVEDENDSDDPSKEELLRERVKKMQTESMEKKLERMEDPDMLTKEERRILTEGASVAKDLGAKLPKYFDDVSSASRGNGLSRDAEEEKVEEEDEWENALPTKKKNPKKSEAVSMSPVKKVVSGNDSLRKLEVVDASIDLLEQQQPSSPTVIPERKDVATSSSNILPTTDEKKSNAMNELRRKQSSERIHARAVAAREALRQSKSSQINDELDELYERVVVSPSSGGGKENTTHRGTASSSEGVTVKKATSLHLSSSSEEEDEEEEEEEEPVVFISYAEKPKPMTLAEAEMFRDAKKVSQLMQRAESAFTKWM